MGVHVSLEGAGMTPLGPRVHLPEHLDRADLDPGLLGRSLEDLSRVNRWFGGDRALRRHLAGDRKRARTLRLLDVGAGRGDVPLRLLRWAAGAGGRWHVAALDRHPRIPGLARERGRGTPGFVVVRGDALRLPFQDGSFHVVLANLTLHHFRDEDAVRFLREMARVASERILVNDLERSRIHYAAVRALAATLWRGNPVTRHDGPRSVRRGFTPAELGDLAERAGLAPYRVRRHFPYRLVLEGRRPALGAERSLAGAETG